MKKEEYNASDADMVAAQAEKNKIRREQELEDLRILLGTDAGIRFFQRLIEVGKVFSTSFTGNSHTFFNEGRRDVALQILGDITDACPHLLAKVLIKKEEDESDA